MHDLYSMWGIKHHIICLSTNPFFPFTNQPLFGIGLRLPHTEKTTKQFERMTGLTFRRGGRYFFGVYKPNFPTHFYKYNLSNMVSVVQNLPEKNKSTKFLRDFVLGAIAPYPPVTVPLYPSIASFMCIYLHWD